CCHLGGCEAGHSKLTRGYRLPARHVIHTVGPIWEGGNDGEPDLLRRCYWSSLEIARHHGLQSVAFPCISTGAFGYPAYEAAQIAVAAVQAHQAETRFVCDVIFCCYSPVDRAFYESILRPPPGAGGANADVASDWRGVVLPAPVCQRLQQIEAAMQSALHDSTAEPFNVLLWGKPGVGKTAIRQSFRNHAGLHTIDAGWHNLKGAHTGESARLIEQLFEQARKHGPSIIGIDALEYLFPLRGSERLGTEAQDRVMALLTQLDVTRTQSPQVFIVAETYDLEKVDPAILASGFLTVEIPLPDETCRAEILRRQIQRWTVSKDFDVDEVVAMLARRLQGETGRGLAILMTKAVRRAAEAAESQEEILVTRDMVVRGAEEGVWARTDESATWSTLAVSDHTMTTAPPTSAATDVSALRLDVQHLAAADRLNLFRELLNRFAHIEFDVERMAEEFTRGTETLTVSEIEAIVGRAGQAAATRAIAAGTPGHVAVSRDDLVEQLPPANTN
ncbi:MAG: macro domain-containing protein, partial [Sciscionella sp.]